MPAVSIVSFASLPAVWFIFNYLSCWVATAVFEKMAGRKKTNKQTKQNNKIFTNSVMKEN